MHIRGQRLSAPDDDAYVEHQDDKQVTAVSVPVADSTLARSRGAAPSSCEPRVRLALILCFHLRAAVVVAPLLSGSHWASFDSMKEPSLGAHRCGHTPTPLSRRPTPRSEFRKPIAGPREKGRSRRLSTWFASVCGRPVAEVGAMCRLCRSPGAESRPGLLLSLHCWRRSNDAKVPAVRQRSLTK